ncbi:MAG TPA: TetR/AcrR family transcriptional regulator [Candidatus Brachybacterium merdavium]|uniref:TetR/AcrR family transcriptional regulator n=1 Tax=Candidatus Brachybacterium merdavium TaxID=2838513 RepID=A0A9D2LF06_9MICO|nr:TetR/AcrR family transcriptional regulator [Candidatus Brachybacterium merdavium]
MAEEEVSRVVAMAWGVAAAPQRGPKRELSHERIVEAAMEIADAEGLDAVTMQRVARSFGFTTMALYRYVSSKSDLHQLMLDASLGDEQWVIDGDDWRVGLEQWARTIAQAYSRHPWALDIPLSTESLLMPGQLRAVDAGMRAARTLPGGADDKLAVLMVLSVQVRGFAVMDRDMRTGAFGAGEATRQLLRDIVAEGGFPDARPVIESGVYFSGVEAGVEGGDDFSTALGLLMPGLERALEGREPVASAAEPELTPEAALAAAEAELASATALRKATQRRVRELEKREARMKTARDAAKSRAKEAAKSAARVEEAGLDARG